MPQPQRPGRHPWEPGQPPAHAHPAGRPETDRASDKAAGPGASPADSRLPARRRRRHGGSGGLRGGSSKAPSPLPAPPSPHRSKALPVHPAATPSLSPGTFPSRRPLQ